MPKASRGIGLLNLHCYSWAVHLTQVVDWKVHARCKWWVGLEHLVAGLDLCLVPWFSREHMLYALIGATFHAFDRACDSHVVSLKLCPTIPVRGKLEFSSNQSKAFSATEWLYSEVLAKLYFHIGHLLWLTELVEIFNTALFNFWPYLQLKQFIDNPLHRECFSTLGHSWCWSLCALELLPRVRKS